MSMSMKCVNRFTENDADLSAAVNQAPDGNLLVAAGEQPHPIEFDQDTGEVRIIDASNGKDLQILTTSGAVTGITFSADGRLLAAAGHSRTVTVWDVSAFQAKAAK